MSARGARDRRRHQMVRNVGENMHEGLTGKKGDPIPVDTSEKHFFYREERTI